MKIIGLNRYLIVKILKVWMKVFRRVFGVLDEIKVKEFLVEDINSIVLF